MPYSTTLTANSGTLPYTWAASGLPGGLSINAASGVLSGTPTVAGSFDITFTVTDVAGASKSQILTLNLLPAPTADPNALPDWTVDVPYPSTTLTATGGQAPYTWSATGMPPGLTIGAASGTVCRYTHDRRHLLDQHHRDRLARRVRHASALGEDQRGAVDHDQLDSVVDRQPPLHELHDDVRPVERNRSRGRRRACPTV